MKISSEFVKFLSNNDTAATECEHILHIYPTHDSKTSYETKQPFYYAGIIVLVFVFASAVFIVYDCFVTKFQNRTEQKASQSSAIVQELFPGNVAAQLFGAKSADEANNLSVGGSSIGNGPNSTSRGNTIADLYPAATVLCKSFTTSKEAADAKRQILTQSDCVLRSCRHCRVHGLEFD